VVHSFLKRKTSRMVDPKGVVTDMAYTPRGWLSSVTVTPPGGVARTTGYSYGWPSKTLSMRSL
jgi:hypothetical protein